jgi:hypothetical protein
VEAGRWKEGEGKEKRMEEREVLGESVCKKG